MDFQFSGERLFIFEETCVYTVVGDFDLILEVLFIFCDMIFKPF